MKMRATEERNGFAGGLQAHGTQNRGAPRVPRGVTSAGGLGAMSGPPCELTGHVGAPHEQ